MIAINLDSPVPLEEQVTQEIRRALARGEIAPGDDLPSVRQLAGDLGIHWNTVARAYRRLRDEGLLVVGRGRGVYVRDAGRRPLKPRPEVKERVVALLRDAVTEARLANLDLKSFKELVSGELRFWEDGRDKA
jgi:GntR family transcriptional regulator